MKYTFKGEFNNPTKFINIKFENGKVYQIPAFIVADKQAYYYEHIGNPYDSEFNSVMNNDSGLIYWLYNNMDWSDIEKYAKLISSEPEEHILSKMFPSSNADVIKL